MSFNPFIQVFYFYTRHESSKGISMERTGFNPFIQVFYFYNENYLNKVVREAVKF